MSEPTDDTYGEAYRIGYDFEHRFNENWRLRNAFNASFLQLTRDAYTYPLSLEADNRTLTRAVGFYDNYQRSYNLDTFAVGEFATGSINHQLVAGFNLARMEDGGPFINRPAASIDIYDPVYGQPPGDIDFESDSDIRLNSLGVYVQDLIAITDNLKVLLGGRFDITDQNREENTDTGTVETNQEDDAFSPRVGLLGILGFSLPTACSFPERKSSIAVEPAECHVIQHKLGETCVPANSQRIVTLSIPTLGHALSLGVKPVGSTYIDGKFFLPYLKSKLT